MNTEGDQDKITEKFDWETCLCFELGHQVCSHYENWCSEMEGNIWWAALTEEERMTLLSADILVEKVYEDQEGWPF